MQCIIVISNGKETKPLILIETSSNTPRQHKDTSRSSLRHAVTYCFGNTILQNITASSTKMMRRALLQIPRSSNRALTSTTRPILATPTISRAAPFLITKRQYHEKVLDHYSNPRNVGSMQKNDMDVGTGLVGAPACGDVMKLQIRVDGKTNTISDVKFKTFGCGSAIASSSYLTELVRGMTLEQAGKVRNTEIAKELCLPPVKCEFFRADNWMR